MVVAAEEKEEEPLLDVRQSQMLMDYASWMEDDDGSGVDRNDTLLLLDQQPSQQLRRRLQDCPRRDRDAIWFEMDIMLTSVTQIECTNREWNTIRRELERTIVNARLRDLQITKFDAHICTKDPTSRRQRRRALVNQETGQVVRILQDDEDEYEVPNDEQHRHLGIIAIIFHLFFRGGGKCFLCNPEKDDRLRTLAAEHNHYRPYDYYPDDQQDNHLFDRDDDLYNDYDDFAEDDDWKQQEEEEEEDHQHSHQSRVSASLHHHHHDNVALDEEWSNTTERTMSQHALHQHPHGDGLMPAPQDLFPEEEDDSSQQQRRHLSCGGCYRLDFSRNKYNRRITGTPYVNQWEYWGSHGVRIRAYPRSGSGYAPRNKVRIYDTSYYARDNYKGDPDLGSPNKACPGGGPGRGRGGAPRLSNGRKNPGANCGREGNVIVIQESNKQYADDNARGGKIVFDFRYPIKLKHMGLMDVDESPGDWIEYQTTDGKKHKHHVRGYGDNSIEKIKFFRSKVKKLTISFPGSGAVRYLEFCHDCGKDQRKRENDVDRYYPSPTQRAFENADSVEAFLAILPQVNRELSNLCERTLRQYTSNRNHCLYYKNPTCHVQLLVSTPVNANNCRQFLD